MALLRRKDHPAAARRIKLSNQKLANQKWILGYNADPSVQSNIAIMIGFAVEMVLCPVRSHGRHKIYTGFFFVCHICTTTEHTLDWQYEEEPFSCLPILVSIALDCSWLLLIALCWCCWWWWCFLELPPLSSFVLFSSFISSFFRFSGIVGCTLLNVILWLKTSIERFWLWYIMLGSFL